MHRLCRRAHRRIPKWNKTVFLIPWDRAGVGVDNDAPAPHRRLDSESLMEGVSQKLCAYSPTLESLIYCQPG